MSTTTYVFVEKLEKYQYSSVVLSGAMHLAYIVSTEIIMTISVL